MKRLENMGMALGKYGSAISFIFKNGLGWYFIFPLLLHIGLFYAGMVAISEVTDFVYDYFSSLTNLEDADFFGSAVLVWLAGGAIWLLFKFVFFFVFAYFGGYIVLILLSPVLAVLSEKAEKIATGRTFDSSPEQILKDIVRGVMIAVRNMLMELGLIIIVFFVTAIIGAIPLIGWTIALGGQIFLFLVSAYFYGFSFMDYAAERRKLNVAESTQLMKNNSGSAIGNGTPFAFCLLIPFIGSFIASFLSIVSVVAAVLTVLELENMGRTNLPSRM